MSFSKKDSLSRAFKWRRHWDCLDLFALNVSSCFACVISLLGKSTPHSAHRSLEPIKVLAHLWVLFPSVFQQKDSLSRAFKWRRHWDCLDLFALNVSSCFACVISLLGKSTPHSAHRSLEPIKVLAHLWVLFPSVFQQKRLSFESL